MKIIKLQTKTWPCCMAFLVALLYLNTNAVCQKKYVLEFDKTGKLITDMPERLVKDDTLQFNFNQDEIVADFKKQYIKILQKSSNDLKNRKKLEELYLYYKLFRSEQDTQKSLDSFKKEINILSNNLETKIKCLLDTNGKVEDNLNEIPNFSEIVNRVKLMVNNHSVGEGKNYQVNSIDEKINFKLTHATMDIVLYDWYKKGLDKTNYLNDTRFIEKVSKNRDEYKSEYIKYNSNKRSCEEAIKLNALYDNYKDNWDKLLSNDLNDWLVSWMWLNGANIQFNPFGAFTPMNAERKYPFAHKISFYRAKTNAFTWILNNKDQLTEKVIKILVTDYSNYTDSLKLALNDSLKQEQDKLETKNQENRKLYANQLMYDGKLYVSNDTRSIFMRHHNAANDYEFMGNYRKYYLDNDRIKILVQNQKMDREAKLYEFVSVTQDISSVGETSLEMLDMFQSVTSSLFKSGELGEQQKGKTSDSDCPAYQILRENNIRFNYLTFRIDWLTQQNQINELPEPITDDIADYRTDEAGPSKPKEAPALVKYVIKEKSLGENSDSETIVLDTLKHKVFALHRFQPFYGFSFGLSNRDELKLDENSQLKEVITQRHSQAFVGIKIFLNKTDIHSEQNTNLSNLSSRTSVLLGFDLKNLKPTDNVLLGLGVDVFPGFNFSCYLNPYRNTDYKIESGKYIANGNPFSLDYGIMLSLDPIVVTKFYSLFQPK